MNISKSNSGSTAPNHQEQVSRQAFERLVHVHGEGDDWDFKLTLGNLRENSARVNLAKDALAFCNLPTGGTIIVGVDREYAQVGLKPGEHIDTTEIRRAVEKYIDGDFVVLAAEHSLFEAEDHPRRYGIVYFRRASAQPVLASMDGNIAEHRSPLFRSGDILIRRGAGSIRANSEDVRRLLTNSIVHEERVRAVNEVWASIVGQRRLVGGIELLYDVLTDREYSEVATNPKLRASRGRITQHELATKIDDLQLRVNLVRPHIPTELYNQYRLCAAFLGRIQMKEIRQGDAGIFVSWTDLDDGSPDLTLHEMASQLLSDGELAEAWAGDATSLGNLRPLRPVLDATEAGLLELIRKVLAGLG